MIGSGFVAFAVQPDGAGMDVLAALFGIGVGLTVDECALWLDRIGGAPHLERPGRETSS